MKTWETILVGLVGVILGVLINRHYNRQNTEHIINAITAQIVSLKGTQELSGLSQESQQRIKTLQAEIDLLKSQKA